MTIPSSLPRFLLVALALTLAPSPRADAAEPPWSADSAFTAHIDFGVQGESAHAIAMQADGKILVAGISDGQMAMARLLPGGSLDTAFDGDGKAVFDFGAGVNVRAVWVQEMPDGRIVVVGNQEAPPPFRIVAMRLLADGSPDPTFGVAGRQALPEGVNAWCSPVNTCDAALLADGSLLVPSLRIDGGGGVSVFKFGPEGPLDPGFGDGGIVTLDTFPGLGGPLAQAVGLEVLPDGRMLVTVSAAGRALALIRLEADGSVDPAFAGEESDVAVVESGYAVTVASMQVDAEGRAVLGLVLPRSDGTTSKFAALRFDADGAPDASFGVDGFAAVEPVPNCGTFCLSVGLALDADGRILLAGAALQPAVGDSLDADVAIARFTPDGEVDTTFAPDGVLQLGTDDIDAGAVYVETGHAMALDRDGRVLVAGRRSGDDGDAMQVWRVRGGSVLRDGFE